MIVPAYNAAQWIAETLDSISAQTFVDWEALVSDDASTDDTPRIIAEHAKADPRIRHVRLPANTGGPAGPRNVAVNEARGDWVAFCDADDLWHPQKLALQLSVAKEHSADLVCTGIRDFSPPDPHAPNAVLPQDRPLRAKPITLSRLLGKNIIPNSSVLCRRAPILEAGGFDTARKLVAVEDYDLWLRLLERGARIVKIDAPLVHYRRLPGSLSARKARLARRVLLVLKRHFSRRGMSWVFPLAAPWLMASYACQAVYLRLWRGHL